MHDQAKNIPVGSEPSAEAVATQTSILLQAAIHRVDEEFKRSERLDGKARNQMTIAGSVFAIGQAIAVGLINGSLAASESVESSLFLPWIAGVGVVALVGLAITFYWSQRAWALRADESLATKTIKDYLPFARKGNQAVGVKLVEEYAGIAKTRCKNNELRADDIQRARWSALALVFFVTVEVGLAFFAVIQA